MTKRKFRYNWRSGEWDELIVYRWDGIRNPYIMARPYWEVAPDLQGSLPLYEVVKCVVGGFMIPTVPFLIWWLL